MGVRLYTCVTLCVEGGEGMRLLMYVCVACQTDDDFSETVIRPLCYRGNATLTSEAFPGCSPIYNGGSGSGFEVLK